MDRSVCVLLKQSRLTRIFLIFPSFNTNHELVYLWTTARMPVHSLIFINPAGSVIYSKYFQDTATSDYKLFFEQQLFKQTSPTWNRVSSVPSTVSIADVHVVYQTIGDMIVFASGTDDVDESICKAVELLHASSSHPISPANTSSLLTSNRSAGNH